MSKANVISRRRVAVLVLFSTVLSVLPTRSAADPAQKRKGDELSTLTPYLLFDGNCRQAMEFYRFCFGGELTATAVKDSPVKDRMPAAPGEKDGVPITDGIFPESKEFLLGYWIVDVPASERAYVIAGRISAAPGPGGVPTNMPIEVRQILASR